MIILPAIDILDGKCVRLFQGDYNKKTEYGDSPVDIAKQWEKEGAKYIHLVDLDGAKEGRIVNIDSVRNICDAVSVPCELGGGIRTINNAKQAFDAGISRIILGTVACEDRELVKELLEKYGPERIVIGIDAKEGKVAVKGWLENSGIDALKLALDFAILGIKRFIYTDISRDGALIGPNFDAIIDFCKTAPDCNVIASGGVGSEKHIEQLKTISSKYPNLEGVIVGKALYDDKINLKDLL